MGHDINILIGGAAGQGIQTIGTLLAGLCHREGLHIFSYDDFQSRIRGGHSFHLLRISNQPLSAPRLTCDILVAISPGTYDLHRHRLTPNGVILRNQSPDETDTSGILSLPLEQLASEAGARITANTVAAGAVAAILGMQMDRVREGIQRQFGEKGERILSMNLSAVEKGFQAASRTPLTHGLSFSGKPHASRNIMSGSRAAALGALAADCRFFPFYPMSPGTGIIEQVSEFLTELPIVVEQAEDEIAAITMAIGASCAGVRTLTATSGGGFSLMTEGLGLAGITETPVVIINAQRPGPATGMATRTAQADLLFAIHASQDEFPRFVIAPGTVGGTAACVKKAVHLAEKYQVPAIVLMDQFLIDSSATVDLNWEDLVSGEDNQRSTVSQDTVYQRYRLTESGISDRIAPGQGKGLFRMTGNEHTPEGFPDDGPDNRVAMVTKRFKKVAAMKREMSLPTVFSPDAAFFLTGWGSTRGCIMEACLRLRKEEINVGWILFEDLWPLDARSLTDLLASRKLIMVEGNATSQLGMLLRQITGLDYFSSVLKYDGRPIFPDYIIEKVKQIIGR
jgi:2-oxoglutarate/2-oxoacid ferredoxin oxidoreductase subunit alpha